MNNFFLIAIVAITTVTMNIPAYGQKIAIEKGLPVTLVSKKKTYIIEKCELNYSVDKFISIEVFGEGFDMGSLDAKGKFSVICSYTSKGKEYYFNTTSAGKTSLKFILFQYALPYPESIIFYPKGGKKVKIEI